MGNMETITYGLAFVVFGIGILTQKGLRMNQSGIYISGGLLLLGGMFLHRL